MCTLRSASKRRQSRVGALGVIACDERYGLSFVWFVCETYQHESHIGESVVGGGNVDVNAATAAAKVGPVERYACVMTFSGCVHDLVSCVLLCRVCVCVSVARRERASSRVRKG